MGADNGFFGGVLVVFWFSMVLEFWEFSMVLCFFLEIFMWFPFGGFQEKTFWRFSWFLVVSGGFLFVLVVSSDSSFFFFGF